MEANLCYVEAKLTDGLYLFLFYMYLCVYRESIYRLLPQTTPENIAKNFDQYTIDPGTRYPNLNSSCLRPHQVRKSTHFALEQYPILTLWTT